MDENELARLERRAVQLRKGEALDLIAEVRRLQVQMSGAQGLLTALVISSGTDYIQPDTRNDDSYRQEVTVTVEMLKRARRWLARQEGREPEC